MVGDVVLKDNGLSIVEVAEGTPHSFRPADMRNNDAFFMKLGCKKNCWYAYRFCALPEKKTETSGE